MRHGGGNQNIQSTNGNPLPPVAADGHNVEQNPHETGEQFPKHPKADGALLFDKNWQNSQAAERRNNLTAIIDNAVETRLPREAKPPVQPQNENNPNFQRQSESHPIFQRNGESNSIFQHQEKNNSISQRPENNNSTFQPQEKNDSIFQRQNQQAKTSLVTKSLDDLISLAKQHPSLEKFRGEPKKFWDDVKKMSELRLVETYAGGKPEPRAASRYGDLLALLKRFGGDTGADGGKRLESFLNSLPRGERNVFLARYQINQTFGADELFAGRGVALDKNGRFPVRIFLAANGKNPQISANSILSFIGGDIAAMSDKITAFLEQNDILPNGQFLFNPKNAALLGLSLALYQNINALLSFDELTPEAFLPKAVDAPIALNQIAAAPTEKTEKAVLPKTFNEQIAAPLLPRPAAAKNTFENVEIDKTTTTTKRSAGETFAAGALINGALTTIENYRKAKFSSVDLWTKLNADADGLRFSAGATGTMMSATIGCVVPLAAKSAGEILGFASSVVVGLSEAGLRSLGANALISVVTSGVQTFLSVSATSAVEKNLSENKANKFLSAADFFENDLRENLFSPHEGAFLVS